MFIGVNLTFIPLHFSGLQGQPRKYVDNRDMFLYFNMISSIGSVFSLFGLFLFILLLLESLLSFKVVLRMGFSMVSLDSSLLSPRIHSYRGSLIGVSK